MNAKEFISKCTPNFIEGDFTWKAPSNIALVKYWGKTHPQIPKNTSLSFTLSQSFTKTKLHFIPIEGFNETGNFEFEVYLDGELKTDFKPKINDFFQRILEYVPFIAQLKFEIHTHNSFPHSSGIASSASSFAALSLCIMSIERSFCPDMEEAFFYQKAAFLARLGSGSATRSVRGNLVLWGKHLDFKESSDLFGITYDNPIHPVFTTYQDTILLVDKGQKQVSSSVGHGLMNNHPFAAQRFLQANQNVSLLAEILEHGNLVAFIDLVESEALSLHAMMMTASPHFILMRSNTLAIIHKIWAFRKETKTNICFTLDAGANVHVLYPITEKDSCIEFIDRELRNFCQNNQYICDEVGDGAVFFSELAIEN